MIFFQIIIKKNVNLILKYFIVSGHNLIKDPNKVTVNFNSP